MIIEAEINKLLKTVDNKTARLFAADCAERVLHIFEDTYPHDVRPRRAIEASRGMLPEPWLAIQAAHEASRIAHSEAHTIGKATCHAAFACLISVGKPTWMHAARAAMFEAEARGEDAASAFQNELAWQYARLQAHLTGGESEHDLPVTTPEVNEQS